MKNLSLALLFVALVPATSFANSAKKPLVKSSIIQGLNSKASIPAYISIKSMANPSLVYSRNNSDLGITVTGAAQTQDESSLDLLLGDASVRELADGGIEIDIRTQGMYSCNITTFNSHIHSISGECLLSIQINFKSGPDVPIYLNGNLIRLN